MGLTKAEEQLLVYRHRIDRNGDIYRAGSNKLMKLVFNGRYNVISVSLPRGNTKIGAHRLIALKYIPNPLNLPEVNHINGIKTDNRIENLEWISRAENQRHAVRLGLIKSGERSHLSKYPDCLFDRLKEFRARGVSIVNLAKITGIDEKHLGEVIRGNRRKVAV